MPDRARERAKQRAKRIPRRSSLVARAADSLEAAIGGRTALVDSLVSLDLNEDQAQIFHIIADPRNDKVSLAQLCARHHFSLDKLLRLFRDGRYARAQIEAIDRVAQGLPRVAGDVMEMASIRRKTCPECMGSKRVRVEVPSTDDEGKLTSTVEVRPCAVCGAEGVIELIPDRRTQELALEIGGLFKRKPSGNVNVGVAVQNNPPPALEAPMTSDDLKRVREGTDKLLYPGRRGGEDTSEVIDADVIPPAEVIEVSEVPEKVQVMEQETQRSARMDRSDRSDRSEAFLPPVGVRIEKER